MPRDLPSGTPTRASGYVVPQGKRRLLIVSLGTAAALVALFAILFAAGVHSVASPGRVSSGHAPIDRQCADCHGAAHIFPATLGHVDDLRCNRCHDPGGTHRLDQVAHIEHGTGETAKAHADEQIACAACHAEHRGGADLVRTVDDRTCIRCHQFASFKAHPEFAAVRAGKITGVGLKFTHDRHVAEVRQAGRGCEACHQLGADLAGFEPIDFDRHCASCHTKDGFVDGETDPLDGRLVSAVPPGGPVVTPGARTLVTVSRMTHRDAWVLDNVARLRRIADPEGERAERLALETQIASLRVRLETQPVSALVLANLNELRDILVRDLARPDAASQPSGDDDTALAALTSAMRGVVASLGDAGAGAATQGIETPPSDTSGETPEAVRSHVESRKAELLSVLDAIVARGDPQLVARAQALRARVSAIAPAPGEGAANVDALRASLQSLDVIFRALRGLADAQAPSDAAALAALRDSANSQIGGGLSAEQFEARRSELLRALDAVARQGNPSLQARIALVRQRVLMLRSGESAATRRARLQDALDRVQLEIELASGGEHGAPSAIASERDRRAVEARLALLVGQLARSSASTAAAPMDAAPDAAADVVATLAGPCLKCHDLDGARLAPVAAATRVFRQAAFTHKPHVLQADCLSCHGGISTSKRATDSRGACGRHVPAVPHAIEGARRLHDVPHLSSGRLR